MIDMEDGCVTGPLKYGQRRLIKNKEKPQLGVMYRETKKHHMTKTIQA